MIFCVCRNYYLPHTRVRGCKLFLEVLNRYLLIDLFLLLDLIAVPKQHSELPKKWEQVLISLRRSASVSLEAFLLPTDDPRIQRAREELGKQSLSKDGSKRAPTDWGKCESRHHRARDEEILGQKRPLTDWQEAGSPPMLPDGGWNDWAAAQTERVLDLMDISVLRKAITGIDIRKFRDFSPFLSSDHSSLRASDYQNINQRCGNLVKMSTGLPQVLL